MSRMLWPIASSWHWENSQAKMSSLSRSTHGFQTTSRIVQGTEPTSVQGTDLYLESHGILHHSYRSCGSTWICVLPIEWQEWQHEQYFNVYKWNSEINSLFIVTQGLFSIIDDHWWCLFKPGLFNQKLQKLWKNIDFIFGKYQLRLIYLE